jgi:hypothetical protein
MSAGKGDTPRKVNGWKFRENYDRIFRNKLTDHIDANGLDEVAVMNRLQDHGVVSDNAVMAGDVGNADAAVAWLEKQ